MLIPYDFLISYYMVYNMREYGIVSLIYIYDLQEKDISPKLALYTRHL